MDKHQPEDLDMLRRALAEAKKRRKHYFAYGPRNKWARRRAHEAGDEVRLFRRRLLIAEARIKDGIDF